MKTKNNKKNNKLNNNTKKRKNTQKKVREKRKINKESNKDKIFHFFDDNTGFMRGITFSKDEKKNRKYNVYK